MLGKRDSGQAFRGAEANGIAEASDLAGMAGAFVPLPNMSQSGQRSRSCPVQPDARGSVKAVRFGKGSRLI